jgi:hypothetical protein
MRKYKKGRKKTGLLNRQDNGGFQKSTKTEIVLIFLGWQQLRTPRQCVIARECSTVLSNKCYRESEISVKNTEYVISLRGQRTFTEKSSWKEIEGCLGSELWVTDIPIQKLI